MFKIHPLIAEFIGTAFLLMAVVGSGIMAEQLADGNMAVALLANTIATGAMLIVLITTLGPMSGAHFNPAVTLSFWLLREMSLPMSVFYIIVQILGAVSGVLLAHLMFDLSLIDFSHKMRSGTGQWISEFIATFGLLATILTCRVARPDFVATAVGLYITAAYWFTASTSFANPAVTLARSLSDSFSGILPAHILPFILCQIAGALCATFLLRKSSR